MVNEFLRTTLNVQKVPKGVGIQLSAKKVIHLAIRLSIEGYSRELLPAVIIFKVNLHTCLH